MSTYRCSILVVDDEPAIRSLLSEILENEFDVLAAESAENARALLAQRQVDIILTDQQLPGHTGVQLLEHVCLHSPQTIRIMMTGLGRLEDAVDAINCGRVQYYLFKPFKPDQLLHTLRQAARTYVLERSHGQLLEELRRLNLELEQRVRARTAELEVANRKLQEINSMLKKMALTDERTGLPNLRAIERLAKQELNRRTRYPSALAIGIIDADHFKDINTQHTLTGGHRVLMWLGQTLAQAVRGVDTVGRVGGDEFMVVAPETDLEGAAVLGDRIRSTVADSFTTHEGKKVRITVSIGIAVVPLSAEVTYDQLQQAAAVALGEAKSAGRNRAVIRVLPGTAAEVAAPSVA